MYSLTYATRDKLKKQLAKHLRIKEERIEAAFLAITKEEVTRIARNDMKDKKT